MSRVPLRAHRTVSSRALEQVRRVRAATIGSWDDTIRQWCAGIDSGVHLVPLFAATLRLTGVRCGVLGASRSVSSRRVSCRHACRHPALYADRAPASGSDWLSNANLFDSTTGHTRRGVSVLIRDGRIAQIAERVVEAGDAIAVVDLAGRTPLPGLIEMHAHLQGCRPRGSTSVLTVARRLYPGELRSLDAIHLATALSISTDLGALFSYDDLLPAAPQLRDYVCWRPSEVGRRSP